VAEFVDHLHEHFVDPVIVKRARYMAPAKPGYGTEIKQSSRAVHRYPDGGVWA
jgi:L-fuconate dehydratase